jgi:beta-lactamase regulating signal transducer with metallopeptidase domain
VTALWLALPSLVLAVAAIVLAVWALRLARKADYYLARSIDFAATQIKPEGFRVPVVTTEEAERAVADWTAKKAEALTREINDAASRTPWVQRARPMTIHEANAWVDERTRQLRHDIGEQP